MNLLQGIQELLLNNRGQEKLQVLIDSFQSDTFMYALKSNSKECSSLFELARQCGLNQVFCANTEVDIADTCYPIIESSTTSNSEPTDVISKTGKKAFTGSSNSNTVKSRASNITMDLSSLSSAHLLAVLCMLSYAHKHNGNSTDGINDIRASDGEESEESFADHMLKFDAGMFAIKYLSFSCCCLRIHAYKVELVENMLSLALLFRFSHLASHLQERN